MTDKICNTCHQHLPLTNFSKDRKSPDGLNYLCRSCASVYKKAYREIHKEEIRAKKKKYYETNATRILEKTKKYQSSRKSEKSLYDKEYRKTNREKQNRQICTI